MASLDELKGFNTRRLFEVLSWSDEKFQEWFQTMGLLFKERICSGKLDSDGAHKEGSCQGKGNMSYHWKKDHKFPEWRCPIKSCRATKGFLAGTFFENTHASLKQVKSTGGFMVVKIVQIFQLSYYWCRQTHTIEEIQFDMRKEDGTTISNHAVID